MSINELIAALEDWKRRNAEPEIPGFDPGTYEVMVQGQDGIFESPVLRVEDANGPWIIVKEDEL